MKPKRSLIVVFVIGAVIALLTIGAAPSSKPVFEYKVVERKARQPEELLNRAGNEGWELVAVTESPATHDFTYYLKREIR